MKTTTKISFKIPSALILGLLLIPGVSHAAVELPDILSKAQLEQEFSSFPNESIQPTVFGGERLEIVIHKASKDEKMVVSLDGQELYTWATSTGSNQWVDSTSGTHEFTNTPEGRFHITRMVKDYVSKTWVGAPMPDSIFFHAGVAIHGTSHVGDLGMPVSGGCVRLETSNADTLYDLVMATGARNTVIVVQNDEPANGTIPPKP